MAKLSVLKQSYLSEHYDLNVFYKEKADAGEMLLAVCKESPLSNPVEIGNYRGFKMEVYYDTINTHYCLNPCGAAKHKVELDSDAREI